jgi:triosephosphate isomerase
MRYVVGNWKMAPASFREARTLFEALATQMKGGKSETRVVVCPPFLYLQPFSALIPKGAAFSLGAQDVHYEASGAATGEVAAEQLRDLGIGTVIVGHSERRALGETDAVIAKKTQAVITNGMTAVVCVGELEREGDWHAELIQQTEAAMSLLGEADMERLVIAYEPVWAIGAGDADTPENALTSVLLIRKVVQKRFGDVIARRIPVLYGGSVNAKNVHGFAQVEGISGALPGRASRDAAQFLEIVRAFGG